MRNVVGLLCLLLLIPVSSKQATAQGMHEENFDYHQPARTLVQRGMQALMTCNGLFVSDRTLDQIYEQELKYYRMPALPPYQGLVTVDEALKAVAVGGANGRMAEHPMETFIGNHTTTYEPERVEVAQSLDVHDVHSDGRSKRGTTYRVKPRGVGRRRPGELAEPSTPGDRVRHGSP